MIAAEHDLEEANITAPEGPGRPPAALRSRRVRTRRPTEAGEALQQLPTPLRGHGVMADEPEGGSVGLALIFVFTINGWPSRRLRHSATTFGCVFKRLDRQSTLPVGLPRSKYGFLRRRRIPHVIHVYISLIQSCGAYTNGHASTKK